MMRSRKDLSWFIFSIVILLSYVFNNWPVSFPRDVTITIQKSATKKFQTYQLLPQHEAKECVEPCTNHSLATYHE